MAMMLTEFPTQEARPKKVLLVIKRSLRKNPNHATYGTYKALFNTFSFHCATGSIDRKAHTTLRCSLMSNYK